MAVRTDERGVYPDGAFGFPGGQAVMAEAGGLPAESLTSPDLEHSIVFRDPFMNAELFRASMRLSSFGAAPGHRHLRSSVGNRYQRGGA